MACVLLRGSVAKLVVQLPITFPSASQFISCPSCYCRRGAAWSEHVSLKHAVFVSELSMYMSTYCMVQGQQLALDLSGVLSAAHGILGRGVTHHLLMSNSGRQGPGCGRGDMKVQERSCTLSKQRMTLEPAVNTDAILCLYPELTWISCRTLCRAGPLHNAFIGAVLCADMCTLPFWCVNFWRMADGSEIRRRLAAAACGSVR